MHWQTRKILIILECVAHQQRVKYQAIGPFNVRTSIHLNLDKVFSLIFFFRVLKLAASARVVFLRYDVVRGRVGYLIQVQRTGVRRSRSELRKRLRIVRSRFA